MTLRNWNLRDNISWNYVLKCYCDESMTEMDTTDHHSLMNHWNLDSREQNQTLGRRDRQGGKLSLYLSRDPVAGIIIKLTQERLIGDKETKFNARAQRSHRNRTEHMAERAAFTLLDKEKHREQLTGQKNLGFQWK